VIIPALGAWTTLPRVLEALRPQAEADSREVLLVESSGEISAVELRRRWPWVRVEALEAPVLPGKARNIGAGSAQGELLVFLDADCVPGPGWLDALEAALTADVDAVAGSIVNGTPRSAVGTAGYLLEFADWLPGARHALRHAASCNLLIRRSVLDRVGGFAEDVFPGEDTILTVPLAAAGRLAFAPGARVRHINRTSLGGFFRHQRRLGRAFAQVCARSEFPHRRLGRPALAPLAGPFRLFALSWRLLAHPRQALAALVLLPLLLLGLGGWTIGLAGADRAD
jgi:cellulose synthase/poly-beta-1,6-N-acetylglucosamine synthase-like glycosyltransferase